jgi:hypothetical protein
MKGKFSPVIFLNFKEMILKTWASHLNKVLNLND